MTPTRKFIIGIAALGSLGAGAAAANSFSTANAASPTVAAVASPSVAAAAVDTPVVAAVDSTSTDTDLPDAPRGPHTANGITEEVLTGDTATSVEAAVKAAYPDATIDRMETDAEGATYEAHITQADGSDATVKLDASFAITDTLVGHG